MTAASSSAAMPALLDAYGVDEGLGDVVGGGEWERCQGGHVGVVVDSVAVECVHELFAGDHGHLRRHGVVVQPARMQALDGRRGFGWVIGRDLVGHDAA